LHKWRKCINLPLISGCSFLVRKNVLSSKFYITLWRSGSMNSIGSLTILTSQSLYDLTSRYISGIPGF
jgi:hypothetical protein